jgi:hypothetical protein
MVVLLACAVPQGSETKKRGRRALNFFNKENAAEAF